MGEFDHSILDKTLGEMMRRIANPRPALEEIGVLMSQEMKKNFDEGGRPTTWPPSIRVQQTGGQTLRLSGALMNSLTSEVDGETVSAGPGSAVAYKARILALGGTIRAKNKPYLKFRIPGVGWVQKKEVTIPARDYTYIPPEAEETFGEIMREHVVGPSTGSG